MCQYMLVRMHLHKGSVYDRSRGSPSPTPSDKSTSTYIKCFSAGLALTWHKGEFDEQPFICVCSEHETQERPRTKMWISKSTMTVTVSKIHQNLTGLWWYMTIVWPVPIARETNPTLLARVKRITIVLGAHAKFMKLSASDGTSTSDVIA